MMDTDEELRVWVASLLQENSTLLAADPAEALARLERLFSRLGITDERAKNEVREVILGRLH